MLAKETRGLGPARARIRSGWQNCRRTQSIEAIDRNVSQPLRVRLRHRCALCRARERDEAFRWPGKVEEDHSEMFAAVNRETFMRLRTWLDG